MNEQDIWTGEYNYTHGNLTLIHADPKNYAVLCKRCEKQETPLLYQPPTPDSGIPTIMHLRKFSGDCTDPAYMDEG